MKKKVFMLLDRSASMAGNNMWNEALSGINAYVKALENVDVQLATFDTLGYDVIRNTNSKDWKPVTNEDATPRGGTPLLDAAARTFHSALDSGAERAIVVIITDGEENSSLNYKKRDIETLVNKIKEKNFELVFLGANFDKVGDVAANFGVFDGGKFASANPLNFAQAMAATSTGTAAYLNTGDTTKSFYSDELKKTLSK